MRSHRSIQLSSLTPDLPCHSGRVPAESEFFVVNAQFLVFDTKFLVFNTQFIIFNHPASARAAVRKLSTQAICQDTPVEIKLWWGDCLRGYVARWIAAIAV